MERIDDDHHLWVEKYKPKRLSDIKGHASIISHLENAIRHNNLSHYIFFGSSGTGKTSTIHALCHQIFDTLLQENPNSSTTYADYVLEINASNEQSLIREKIKHFCKKSSMNSPKTSYFKIIILDEADSLNLETQNALRRCIEIYSYNTRFVLLCNYITKIIPAIVSRCNRFHFQLIDSSLVIQYLSGICQKEGIHCTDDTLHFLYRKNNYDIRNSIMLLQAIYHMYEEITLERLEDYFSVPSTSIWNFSTQHTSMEDLIQHILDQIELGYSIRQFLLSFIQYLMEYKHIYKISIFSCILSKMERKALENGSVFLLVMELFLLLKKQKNDFF